MAKDLISGNPTKSILAFTIPMLLGNIFQQFYNIVDSVIVGNYVGPEALAAVGSVFPIIFFYVAIGLGFSMGSSIVISQYFGAKDEKNVRKSITTSMILMIVLAVLLSIAGVGTSRIMLNLLNTPIDIIDDAESYLKIYFAGLIFMFLYNAFSAIYRAVGDSKSPLYFLVIATILNVVLDMIFVVKFKMGVDGVAWATLIAQGVSAILCYIYSQMKMPLLRFRLKDIVYDKALKSKIISLSIPAMIQQVVVSVGMMATQGLVNSYGSSVVAGFTAATKVDSLATMPIMNLSVAVSTFTAQNIGAGKPDRIKVGYKSSLIMSTIFALLITGIIFVLGETFINMFVDSDSNIEVINAGVGYLKIVSLAYCIFGVMFVSNGILRGAGDMHMVTVSSMVSLVIRIIFAYAFNERLGFTAIVIAMPIGWTIGMLISVIRVRSGKWENKSIVS